MKICPKCQKTYTDETLNFCLNDGAVLNEHSGGGNTDDSLPATVMMDSPRPTTPQQSFGGESQSGFGGSSQQDFGNQPQTQAGWGSQPTHQISNPKPKSKTWLWVLGILFGVMFICGGGFALIVAVSSMDDGVTVENTNDDKKSDLTFKDTPSKKSDDKNSDDFNAIDISRCAEYGSDSADAEFKNDECILGTKKTGFYYVIVNSAHQTDDGRTRVTVRNTEEKSTRLGFGLVFHSKPTPLVQDYAFLIDSENQKYRVVQHKNQKETNLINWKSSKVIKKGTQKNVLEIRAEDGKIDLYINDQYIDSLKDKNGYDGGVPGIYTGDGIPVAFSKLQTTN